MTDAEFIAIELADAYGLDPVLLMGGSAFVAAVAQARAVMSTDEIVAGVRAKGGLGGLANPYAGLIARIRRLPEEHALRQKIVGDKVEAARWKAVDNAARMGERLGDLVASGQLFADEAEEEIEAKLADANLRAIALAGFRGRQL
jgi:hypothetical protein